MNSFGFFCFTLALVFALSVFALEDSANAITEKTSEAKTIAIALEQASMKRFELEQNADKAIAFAMEKSVREGRESPEQIKENANAALIALFESEKAQSRESIEFYSATASRTQYSQLAFLKKSNKLEKENLQDNSKAISIGLLGHAYTIEYSITGGLLKNKIIFALIGNAQGKQLFVLPIDYSNEIKVVK